MRVDFLDFPRQLGLHWSEVPPGPSAETGRRQVMGTRSNRHRSSKRFDGRATACLASGNEAGPGGNVREDKNGAAPSFHGMPRRLLPLTPMRLSTWLDCPAPVPDWTTSTGLAPPKGAPWADNSSGAAVHNASPAGAAPPARRAHAQAVGTLLTRGCRSARGFADDEQVGQVPPVGQGDGRGERRHCWIRRTSLVGGSDGRDPSRADRRLRAHRPARMRDSRRAGWNCRRRLKTGRHALTTDHAALRRPRAVRAGGVAVAARRAHPVELHHLPTAG